MAKRHWNIPGYLILPDYIWVSCRSQVDFLCAHDLEFTTLSWHMLALFPPHCVPLKTQIGLSYREAIKKNWKKKKLTRATVVTLNQFPSWGCQKSGWGLFSPPWEEFFLCVNMGKKKTKKTSSSRSKPGSPVLWKTLLPPAGTKRCFGDGSASVNCGGSTESERDKNVGSQVGQCS